MTSNVASTRIVVATPMIAEEGNLLSFFQPLAIQRGERNLQNKQFLAFFLCKMTNKKT